MSHSQIRQILVHGFPMSLIFAIVIGAGLSATAGQPDRDKLVGQPAELSAWAYAYRADRKVQEHPEAYFVLRTAGTARSGIPSGQPLAFSRQREEGIAVAEAELDWQLLSKKRVESRRDVAGAERSLEIRAALGRTHALEPPGTPLAEQMDRRRPAKRGGSRVSIALRLVRLAIGSAGHGQARNLRGRF